VHIARKMSNTSTKMESHDRIERVTPPLRDEPVEHRAYSGTWFVYCCLRLQYGDQLSDR